MIRKCSHFRLSKLYRMGLGKLKILKNETQNPKLMQQNRIQKFFKNYSLLRA